MLRAWTSRNSPLTCFAHGSEKAVLLEVTLRNTLDENRRRSRQVGAGALVVGEKKEKTPLFLHT